MICCVLNADSADKPIHCVTRGMLGWQATTRSRRQIEMLSVPDDQRRRSIERRRTSLLYSDDILSPRARPPPRPKPPLDPATLAARQEYAARGLVEIMRRKVVLVATMFPQSVANFSPLATFTDLLNNNSYKIRPSLSQAAR